jgi:hypothetical protein
MLNAYPIIVSHSARVAISGLAFRVAHDLIANELNRLTAPDCPHWLKRNGPSVWVHAEAVGDALRWAVGATSTTQLPYTVRVHSGRGLPDYPVHSNELPSLVRCTPLPRAKAAREGLAAYCFSAGGFASGVGGGSAVGAVPRSPDAAAQSPAQSLVPLTVPTSLQPIGATGFACFCGLPTTLGAAA